MGSAKATAAVYLLALSALGGAEVTTTGTGMGTFAKAIHSITTTTTTATTSRTVTHTSATSPAGRTSTSTDSVPGVTHIPNTAIILSIVPARSNPRSTDPDSYNKSSAENLFFVSTTAPLLARSCADASPFTLVSGRLSRDDDDGAYLSTIPDVVYQPLCTTRFSRSSPGRGTRDTTTTVVDTTFAVEEGYLRWYDARFYGGRARYCMSGETGVVNVVFHIGRTWPVGCEEVDVRVFRESECRDGGVVEGRRIGEIGEGEKGKGRKGGEARTTGGAMVTGTGVETSATVAAGGWDEL